MRRTPAIKSTLTNERNYLRLYTLLLAFQRRRRMLRRAYRVAMITTAEAHILLYLDTAPDASATELAAVLNLDKSTLSREIAQMRRKGLLSIQLSTSDRRKRVLVLPAKAKNIVCELDHSQRYIMGECLAALSAQMESRLGHYLKTLADGLGAKPAVKRVADHRVSLEIRRLARVLGMLGDKPGATELVLSQVHLLESLVQADTDLAAADLTKVIPLDASTISRHLKHLARRGWITRRPAQGDKRKRTIQLTAAGKRVLALHQNEVARRFHAALKSLTAAQLHDFLELLQAVAGPRTQAPKPSAPEGIKVRRLRETEELTAARGFLLEEMVQRNMHYLLGSHILSGDGLVYALYENDKLKGVCELRPQAKKWVLQHYVVAGDAGQGRLSSHFWGSVVEDCLREKGIRKMAIPRDSAATALARQSGARRDEDRSPGLTLTRASLRKKAK